MGKEKLISDLYRVLLLYEDASDDNSDIMETDYQSYLQRLYVRFNGRDDTEIADTLKGLSQLGMVLPHKTVKSVVFHLIDIVNKEGVDNAI